VHEQKKGWSSPKVSTFDTPEQVWAKFSPKAKPEELRALIDLLQEMRRARDATVSAPARRRRRA
jgi:hypothetical protein